MSAVSGARVIFLCKFQKNEQITVLGSVYIAEVNVLFYTKCAILHRYQCFILHLACNFTSDGYIYICVMVHPMCSFTLNSV